MKEERSIFENPKLQKIEFNAMIFLLIVYIPYRILKALKVL